MILEIDFQNRRIVNREQIETAVSTLADGRYLLEFEKLPMKRSDAQNKYLHAVIIPTYQKLFNDIRGRFHENIVKGMIKEMFLKEEIVCEISGEIFTIIKDTRDLNVSEFDEFLQNCRLWYEHNTGEQIALPRYYAEGL
jgi:hypothetical protein